MLNVGIKRCDTCDQNIKCNECVYPFNNKELIKEIDRLQEENQQLNTEIERLTKLLDDKCIEEEKVFSVDFDIHSIKTEGKKEVFEELISMCNAPHWCVWLSEITDLAEKMGVKVDAD